ncbi:M10 family metallopeptidase [Phenylobacterium sp.]|uniref:M10 family metallopeptidase n=1 Tax=Phenylobacterium sp. TaxID=1871053 RepID=UPI0035B3AEFA
MAAPDQSTIVNSLLYANQYWSGSTVTWSAATATSVWSGYGPSDEPYQAEYATLSAFQVTRFAEAVAAWDKLVAIDLVQVSDTEPGQIRVAFTNTDSLAGENVWGYAYAPPYQGSGTGTGYQGDVWIDYNHGSSTFAEGSYDYMVLIHELGHALGLKHPFEDGATLPTDYDNINNTVMSYTDGDSYVHWTFETTQTGIQSVPTEVYPSTPMVYDIAAIQARYGADPNTEAGDTTYTWSQSNAWVQAIYDAGGNDTFDLSNFTRGSIVDLTPGAYSSIGYWSEADQVAYWSSKYGWASDFIATQLAQSPYTWSNNVGIAYSTVIENAIGGSGNDTITGNDVANTLRGGAGDDSLSGGLGQDYLRGEDGNDVIQGGADFDNINGNAGNDTAHGGAGDDWVVGGKDQDLLYGDDGNDVVNGNMGLDTVYGGAGDDWVRGGQNNDSLSGGDGNDWLSGDKGDDTISGGAGADTFHTSGDAGIDRVIDFSRAEGDSVLVDAGTTYTVSQVGADVVIDMTGGGQMILVGVTLSSLTGDWITGA